MLVDKALLHRIHAEQLDARFAAYTPDTLPGPTADYLIETFGPTFDAVYLLAEKMDPESAVLEALDGVDVALQAKLRLILLHESFGSVLKLIFDESVLEALAEWATLDDWKAEAHVSGLSDRDASCILTPEQVRSRVVHDYGTWWEPRRPTWTAPEVLIRVDREET